MSNVSSLDRRPQFLIADDHAIFAEALRIYLEKTYPVVGVVLDGRAMVDVAVRETGERQGLIFENRDIQALVA